MNDSVFAGYDTLFGPNGVIQSTELQHQHNGNQQQRIAEHDLQATTLYFSVGQSDSGHVAAANSHHQGNISVSSNGNGSSVCRNETNLIAAALNNVSNASSFNSTHNNIPFVQIHTTDVQPQRNNYGNVFRRAATSVAEIKSEPIKSETADNSKDRVNATPTPPVRSGERVTTPASSNQHAESINPNVGSTVPVAVGDTSSAAVLLDVNRAYQSVRKCSHCRFLCLSEATLGKHMLAAHDTTNPYHNTNNSCPSNKQIPCPEIHLVEDHMASVDDAKEVIGTIANIDASVALNPPVGGEKTTDEPYTQQRKSRIYLKNVECLREPRRHEPMTGLDGPPPASHNHVADGFFSLNSFSNLERNVELSEILNNEFSDIAAQLHQDKQHASDVSTTSVTDTSGLVNSKPKQKISIKSVDVLREPGLLRREYELQNQFATLPNVCNDNVCFEPYGTFPIQPISETTGIGGSNESNNFNINNANTENMCSNDNNNMERLRRPKIYIKNVDILKEPIILPPFASGNTLGLQDPSPSMNYNFLTQSMQQTPSNTDFLNTINNLGVPNQVFDGELPMGGTNIADAYLFENANTNGAGNKGNSMLSDIASISTSESYQGYGNVSGSANVNVNPNFLSYPLLNCANMETPSSTPIITEPTPPPAPVFNLQSVEHALPESMETTPTSTPTSTPTPPQQKQKIFIKNVDILKEPQFQEQRERGTLHLRTVDELNLMNRNEVESLIAPNLENNNANHCGSGALRDNFSHSDDLTALPEDEEILYGDETMKLQEYATQLVNSWSGEDYDLSEGIGCIITDSIEPISNLPTAMPSLSPNSASQSSSMPKILHDLETPQMSLISIRDIEELTVPHQQQQPAMICLEQGNSNQTQCDLTPLDSHGLQHDLCTNSMEGEIAKPCVTCTDGIAGEKNESQQDLPQSTSAVTASATVSVPLNAVGVPPNSTTTTAMPLDTSAASFTFNLPLEMPPLTPMTNFSLNSRNIAREGMPSSSAAVVTVASTIPMPPLVPVSTLVPTVTSKSSGQAVSTLAQATSSATNSAGMTTITSTAAQPTEQSRGRIYVANNLMQIPPADKRDAEHPAACQKATTSTTVSVTGGTSVRGRPFGSNRSDNAVKQNKVRPETGEVALKCSVRGCAFRFKKPDTLNYHIRCHDKNSSSLQAKLCPECKSTDFSNWNTLHTHLWRSHQIDMELYSCPQCPFKTPIYSRLINTHTKIHSEERNYKCDQCGKAFKNTKQLKNHRRWHRTHANVTNATTTSSNSTTENTTNTTDANPVEGTATTTTAVTPADVHRCSDCGAAFSHLKTLREHSCKKSEHQLQCSVCGHAASSKSSLKLHMFTHENSKRLKCSSCTYSTSDHNAFRRHKMTHENTKMYTCPHCSYKSIQSITFQKHVLLKHPDAASTLIHKCKQCSYSTVNRTLFAVHQIKHKSPQSEIILNDGEKSNSSVELIEIDAAAKGVDNNSLLDDNVHLNANEKNSPKQMKQNSVTASSQQKTIKVKSDLLIKDKVPRLSAEFITIDTDETKLTTGTTTLMNGISI